MDVGAEHPRSPIKNRPRITIQSERRGPSSGPRRLNFREVRLPTVASALARIYGQSPGMFGSKHLLTDGMSTETLFVVSVSTMLLYETWASSRL
jgi:hypothetical protein